MEKKSSSEDIESTEAEAEAEAEAGAYKLYACFLVEAVKAIILKCLGMCNVQESCSCSADPPPTSTPAITDPDPPAGDGAAGSFATPPRPGGTTGSGPQIN